MLMFAKVVWQVSDKKFGFNGPDREPVLDADLKTAARCEGERIGSTGRLRIIYGEVGVESMHATGEELPVSG